MISESHADTVVIGDHSLSSARDLADVFAAAGIKVVATCTDGLSLVTAARRHRPAFLCLDIIMPRLSGLQVLATLRGEICSRVIVATAVSSRGRVAEAKRLGVSMYLLKPYDSGRFLAALRTLSADVPMRSAS